MTVYGTAGDDGDDVTMDHHDNSLTVKAGDGDDTLNVETRYGELGSGGGFTNTVNADMGKGDNKVSLSNTAGVMEADIKAGDGDDTVTVTQAGTYASADINAGEGGNDITFALNEGAAKADIKAGDGNDRVTLTGTGKAKRSVKDGNRTYEGSLTVNLGAGDDTVSADAALGNGYSAA